MKSNKQFYNFLLIWILGTAHYSLESITERLKPSGYTGLSGRMLYYPLVQYKDPEIEENSNNDILLLNSYQKAYERNKRMRSWQYQRVTKRQKGSYNDYRSSETEPLIGITSETNPIK